MNCHLTQPMYRCRNCRKIKMQHYTALQNLYSWINNFHAWIVALDEHNSQLALMITANFTRNENSLLTQDDSQNAKLSNWSLITAKHVNQLTTTKVSRAETSPPPVSRSVELPPPLDRSRKIPPPPRSGLKHHTDRISLGAPMSPHTITTL